LWFDGSNSTAAEAGTATQTVTIPAGAATLSYYLRIGSVTAPSNSTLVVRVDGTAVQTITEPAVAEIAYTQRTVDISAFANGASHIISFNYSRPAATTGSDSFTVDDVSLSTACSVGPTPTPSPTPTPGSSLVVSYTGPAVAIPDNVQTGVNIPIVVGAACTVTDLNFRFDGTASPDPASTAVGVNHSWVGDLKFRLTSPGGTSVTFFDRPGLPASALGCDSNNLAALTLVDDGAFSTVETQCGSV